MKSVEQGSRDALNWHWLMIST